MSQINCKINNFTLSKLTFNLETDENSIKYNYILSLADSIETMIDQKEYIIKIIKLNEKDCNLVFKYKLSEKFAFVEDYSNQDIYIQDLNNFKKIKRIIENNEKDTNKILHLVDYKNKSISNNNETESSKSKEINEEKININNQLPNINLDSNLIDTDTILVCKLDNLRTDVNDIILQNKTNCEKARKEKLIVSDNEEMKDKINQGLPFIQNENLEDIKMNISASWTNFIEHVKSNIIQISPGVHTQEDIIQNKEKLLNEIMNDTICEEIYVEEGTPKSESLIKAYWKENSNIYENKMENSSKNEKNSYVENDEIVKDINTKLYNPLNKNENYLSQITEKIEEQFALGSEIMKDLNSQYETLCQITANKSYEVQVNPAEYLSKTDQDDADILKQQKQIEDLIQQAISENEKLKNEYMKHPSDSKQLSIDVSKNYAYSSKSSHEVIDNIDIIKSSEKVLSNTDDNLLHKNIFIDEQMKQTKCSYGDLIREAHEENKKSFISEIILKDNIQKTYNDQMEDFIKEKKSIPLIDNEIVNINNNNIYACVNKNDQSSDLVKTNSSLNFIDKNLNVVIINDNIEDNISPKKYQPIDVEEFLKTLFSA